MSRGTMLFCSLFLLLHTSCKSQNSISSNAANEPTIELVLVDNYSGFITEELLIIKDQKSLQLFFAQINKTRKPGLMPPEIDFTKNMLVIWCEGETQNTSLGLSLYKETKAAYHLSKIIPTAQIKNAAIISPFFVYKLPLSNKKVLVE